MLDLLKDLPEQNCGGFIHNAYQPRRYKSQRRLMLMGFWKKLVDEMLSRNENTIEIIAQEIDVSYDTIKRLITGRTHQPRPKVAARLLALHLVLCPDRYGQPPLIKTANGEYIIQGEEEE